MPNITITLTDSQLAALAAAQEHADLGRSEKHATPTAYLQFVVDAACADYAKQFDTETVEGVRNSLETRITALEREKQALADELAAKESAK